MELINILHLVLLRWREFFSFSHFRCCCVFLLINFFKLNFHELCERVKILNSDDRRVKIISHRRWMACRRMGNVGEIWIEACKINTIIIGARNSRWFSVGELSLLTVRAGPKTSTKTGWLESIYTLNWQNNIHQLDFLVILALFPQDFSMLPTRMDAVQHTYQSETNSKNSTLGNLLIHLEKVSFNPFPLAAAIIIIKRLPVDSGLRREFSWFHYSSCVKIIFSKFYFPIFIFASVGGSGEGRSCFCVCRQTTHSPSNYEMINEI